MANEKIQLSYSTISALYEFPHSYLNKVMGLKTKDLPAFREGKLVQKVIFDHINKKEMNEKIAAREKQDKNFRLPTFALTEEVDFDKRLESRFDIDDNYYVVCHPDALDEPTGRVGDIKAYNSGFNASMLRESFQWKIYAIPLPWVNEAVYISASRDINAPDWANTIKVLSTPVTELDREKAKAWIRGAIKIIEEGDFKLEPNTEFRKCLYENCPYCGN